MLQISHCKVFIVYCCPFVKGITRCRTYQRVKNKLCKHFFLFFLWFSAFNNKLSKWIKLNENLRAERKLSDVLNLMVSGWLNNLFCFYKKFVLKSKTKCCRVNYTVIHVHTIKYIITEWLVTCKYLNIKSHHLNSSIAHEMRLCYSTARHCF